MVSIESVHFGADGFHLDGDSPDGGARYWTSTEGDQVGLYLFQLRPDIGADLGNIAALRAFYRTTAARGDLGVMEIETFEVSGVPAIRSLLKGALPDGSRAYIGGVTIPFRDFSFVWRIQCNEDGLPGARETTVLNLLTERGEVSIDRDGELTGWRCDPYDLAQDGPRVRNRADLDVYDAMFPAHALSRARRLLDHLQRTIRLAPEIRDEAPFVFARP